MYLHNPKPSQFIVGLTSQGLLAEACLAVPERDVKYISFSE